MKSVEYSGLKLQRWKVPESARMCRKMPECVGMCQKVPEGLRSSLVSEYYWLASFSKILINISFETSVLRPKLLITALIKIKKENKVIKQNPKVLN